MTAFVENGGCPFCHRASAEIVCEVDYAETSEAHPDLPNIHGRVMACPACGIAYASHRYEVEVFPQLYQKTFEDMSSFGTTPLQTARKAVLERFVRRRARGWNFIEALLQPPRLTRDPRGLSVLDVGCGFGEFLDIYRDLGNRVTGTEILPQFAAALQKRGFDCRLGEVEDIDFADGSFDAVIFRAVFYRTRNPERTLQRIKKILARNGEIVMIDPCPGRDGVAFFARKQFPQGQFYIVDSDRYLAMLEERFGLKCIRRNLSYGRPSVIQKRVRGLQIAKGVAELILGNVFRYRPYLLNYTLVANS